MMRRMSRPRAAYHEAGHVVIAYERMMTFASVSIQPDEDCGGRVVGLALCGGNPSTVDHDLALVYAAGMAADAIRQGRKSVGVVDMLNQHQDGGDMRVLREVTEGMGDLPAYDTRRRKLVPMSAEEAFCAYAIDSITRHWQAVEDVAAALLDRETLTWGQVVPILAPHMGNPDWATEDPA